MGLDMYLNKRHYFYGRTVEIKTDPPINSKRVRLIEEEIAYWRKANQIHRWFVHNIQIDDGGTYEVTKDQLETLLRTVREVLADPKKAPTLLPTQEGFFFGNTDYDEDYFEDLRQTDRMLTEELVAELPSTLAERPSMCCYTYHASW